MIQLSTPVTVPDLHVSLDTDSRVMLIGSCFAQEVGTRLQRMMGEDSVEVNPFGVQYSPVSVERVLRLLMKVDCADGAVFQGRDGMWHSWFHTSHFSAPTEEKCRSIINERFTISKQNLQQANLLILTFGTTRCYRHAQSGIIVGNCHKELPSLFTEYEPSLDELTMQWRLLLQQLLNYNPKLRILFTVSPYRYRKYGMHESQLQKSKLLLLVDTLVHDESLIDKETGESRVGYFPSYEILLDELRDYRFYADDLLHPSNLAVDIITQRFTEATFTPALKLSAPERLKAWRQSQHKTILHRSSESVG